MKQRGWTVKRASGKPFRYDGYEKMLYEDIVFFDVDVDAEDVRRSLIKHDGYPDDITVE
jgi:hypothetical protein